MPVQAPQSFIDKYKGHYKDGWTALRQARRLAERKMEVYAAMAEAMDHHVGRLVSYLKQTGEFDSTVFVFLSDNGAEGSDYRQAQPWLRFMTPHTQDVATLGGKHTHGIPGPGRASASVSPLSAYKFWSSETCSVMPAAVQAHGRCLFGVAIDHLAQSSRLAFSATWPLRGARK